MMEEYDILRNTVREFVDKNVENISLNIEREGIQNDLIVKLGSLGSLTARAPVDKGGSGLDDVAYMIILEELARSSPSVAMKVFLTNMFLEIYGAGSEMIADIASGRINVSVAFPEIYRKSEYSDELKVENGKIVGTKKNVMNGKCNAIIVSADGGNNLYLVRSGFRANEKPHLGIRGMDFSDIEFNSSDFEKIDGKGIKTISERLSSDRRFVAVIFAGLSAGTIDKAVEYSKVRFAFDHPLKDFGPLASSLASMKSEIDMIRNFTYSASDDYSSAVSKIKAKALSVDASRLSLQVHGGYGYIQDFGIEKFYRDAMALSIIFGDDSSENRAISDHIFGGESASV
ncbi:MAG: acyl-CoA dehydrogenase family protein [Thermoplasmata archaeon]